MEDKSSPAACSNIVPLSTAGKATEPCSTLPPASSPAHPASPVVSQPLTASVSGASGEGETSSAQASPSLALEASAAEADVGRVEEEEEACSTYHSAAAMTSAVSCSTSGGESGSAMMWPSLYDQHNSVTIKCSTSVKDAAGAICKVLGRLPSAFVTALRLGCSHDSLNQAIKSVAVARK